MRYSLVYWRVPNLEVDHLARQSHPVYRGATGLKANKNDSKSVFSFVVVALVKVCILGERKCFYELYKQMCDL